MKQKNTFRILSVFSCLILGILLFGMLSIMLGSVAISPAEIVQVLAKDPAASQTSCTILTDIRLPRTAAAILLGGALSVSGLLLQIFFHNSIAGPYVLGISSGAKLIVAILMIGLLSRGILISNLEMVLAAFGGSLLCMGFVLLLSGQIHQMSRLILAGVMIGYICSAVTDFLVTFADDSNIVNLHSWALGSFSGTEWNEVLLMCLIVLPVCLMVFLLAKPISAYQLGENYAANLGVNITLLRVLIITLSSLLSACVTAFAGPISFVGIAVPHLIRSLMKTSKPLLTIPACFLGGALFCLISDLIARCAFSPTELSISSVTAIFGAPIVLRLMLQRRD